MSQKPMTIFDLRARIAEEVDVLANIVQLAKGRIPDEWKKSPDLADAVLSLETVIKANYELLDRIMPRLKSVEFTQGSDNVKSIEDSREKLYAALERQIAQYAETGVQKQEANT